MSRITNARQGLVVDHLKLLDDVFVRAAEADCDASGNGTAQITLMSNDSASVVTGLSLNLNVFTNADVIAELSSGRRFGLTLVLVPMDNTGNGLPVADPQPPTAIASTVCVALPNPSTTTETTNPSA